MPFRNSKTLKIELSNYGSYLGRNKGCFEVRTKDGKKQQYPHFEKQIGSCVMKSGSYVSVDALIDLGEPRERRKYNNRINCGTAR